MARHRFRVRLEVEIEIDDALLEGVLTDEWRARFYVLHTPEDVAHHLAYNFARGQELASLDGFADQAEDAATLVAILAEEEDVVRIDAGTSPTPAPARRRPTPRAPGGGRSRQFGRGRKGIRT